MSNYEREQCLYLIAKSIWDAQRIGLTASEIEEAIIDGLDETTHA